MVWLESTFPGLRGTNWRVTSAADNKYNCIAWAAHDTSAFWWPVGESVNARRYWPANVSHEVTIAAFAAALGVLGFGPCDDENLEAGVEKIALFAGTDNTPTHAARQLPTGTWTSKLGRSVDIEHPLRALEGEVYGTVMQILRRPRPA